MRIPKILSACAAVLTLGLGACQDDVSDIGGSLVTGEVSITVDSLVTDIHGKAIWEENFDARASTKLLGRLTVPEYGSLSCSFVSEMMSATKMNIPDSIKADRVDSARLVLSVPRGSLTGDSLAPQQLKVFRLTAELPDSINSRFDPKGYYDPANPFGTKSYTLTNLALSDSAFVKNPYIRIPVKLPKEFALDLFNKYRTDPDLFNWPASFNKWFPGVYVEQNFGNGCMANITRVEAYLYWHRPEQITVTKDDNTVEYKIVERRDSICLLASAPEVLSSNNVYYTPSEEIRGLVASGKSVITSPGGYVTDISFPIDDLIRRFTQANTDLSVVAGLKLEIPAKTITNDYGIMPAPYLLMVRKSEREAFFRENRIPDNETSFYATYNSSTKSYRFAGMRSYFLKMYRDYRDGKITGLSPEEFTLVPVYVSSETVENYGSSSTYVLRVSPYLAAPSMAELDTEHASIVFTFSTQVIE